MVTHPNAAEGLYEIGCGIYDITGPAAEVGMMGFAEVGQTTQGIFMRLFSRAFIVGDGKKRAVFVCADLCMVYQSVKQGVVKRLQQDKDLAPHYNDANTLISATHTHSGPGGYSHHFIYNLTTKGFIPQNYEAIVEGIYQSIQRAHKNLELGSVFIAKGTVEGFGFNRAVNAYLKNPESERERYADDIDREMTLLKFVAADGTALGMLNWLGVHPTSVGPSNRLIGGDTKGLAEYWFERDHHADVYAQKQFVAAFALAPAGDISPNFWGVADGVHDYEHLEEIAHKQYSAAKKLYASAKERLIGEIDYRHRYVDFSRVHIDALDVDTQPAAMGVSFIAGSTEDNESQVKVFSDGVTVDSLAGHQKVLSKVIDTSFGALWPKTLSPAYIEGQAPKKILIPTGLATWDGNPWSPQILPVQILRWGSLAILAQPTEITTMAGRRLREAVSRLLEALGVNHAVVASHSNAYASYVTTPEEYGAQEYEGASTHFGPHTLDAFIQEYTRLADAIEQGFAVPQGLYPKDQARAQVTLQPGVVYDAHPKDKPFGTVLLDALENYRSGALVSVEFVAAHPRNDLMTMQNFAVVEMKTPDGFKPVAGDRDPELTFRWLRTEGATSKAILTWDTQDAAPGAYRIVYHGVWLSFWLRKKTSFRGESRVFQIKKE